MCPGAHCNQTLGNLRVFGSVHFCNEILLFLQAIADLDYHCHEFLVNKYIQKGFSHKIYLVHYTPNPMHRKENPFLIFVYTPLILLVITLARSEEISIILWHKNMHNEFKNVAVRLKTFTAGFCSNIRTAAT